METLRYPTNLVLNIGKLPSIIWIEMCSKMYYICQLCRELHQPQPRKQTSTTYNTQQQQKNMWYAAKCVMSYMCCIGGTPPAITCTLWYLPLNTSILLINKAQQDGEKDIFLRRESRTPIQVNGIAHSTWLTCDGICHRVSDTGILCMVCVSFYLCFLNCQSCPYDQHTPVVFDNNMQVLYLVWGAIKRQ